MVELPTPAMFCSDPSAFIDPRLIDDLMNTLREQSSKETARLERTFRERAPRDGIESEWRMVEGLTAETVALHARYADLAVLGQRDPDDKSLAAAGDVAATTLLSSGRPVLVLPYVGDYPSVGRKVLVGWKSAGDASRAINDALPLLQEADEVTVLSINPENGIGGDGDVPAAEIALHLARHGVKASAAHTGGDRDSGGRRAPRLYRRHRRRSHHRRRIRPFPGPPAAVRRRDAHVVHDSDGSGVLVSLRRARAATPGRRDGREDDAPRADQSD